MTRSCFKAGRAPHPHFTLPPAPTSRTPPGQNSMSSLGGVRLPAVIPTFYLVGSRGTPDPTVHLPTPPPAWAGRPPAGMVGKRGPCLAPGSGERAAQDPCGLPASDSHACVCAGRPAAGQEADVAPWRVILGTAHTPPPPRLSAEVIGPRPWLKPEHVCHRPVCCGPSILGACPGCPSVLTLLSAPAFSGAPGLEGR